jgi:ABC-2 type transport system ATP-binding protein
MRGRPPPPPAGPPGGPPLELVGVQRRFGDLLAVAGVDLVVEPGELIGLLGRNGAGKSTTMRMCVGLDEPTQGRISILGDSIAAGVARAAVGYCSQHAALYPGYTARRNLEFFGRLYGLRNAEAAAAAERVIGLLGLGPVADRHVSELSGGYERRVHLGAALVHDAPLLVLDEPTAGVDIESKERIANTMRGVADAGAGVLFASHDLSDVERICDRIVILSKGVVKASGTPKQLAGDVAELLRLEMETVADREAVRAELASLHPRVNGRLAVDLTLREGETIAQVLARCEAKGLRPARVHAVAPGLESIFLRVTADDEAGTDAVAD